VAGKPTSAAEAAGETVIAPDVVGLIPPRFTVVPVNTLLPTVIVELPVSYEAHVGAVPKFRVTLLDEKAVIFDHVGAADHKLDVIIVFAPTTAPKVLESGTTRLVELDGL
jgi:hypothetical protein